MIRMTDILDEGVNLKKAQTELNEGVYKTILSDGRNRLSFGLVDDETKEVTPLSLVAWLKSSHKDKSSDYSKKKIVGTIVKNQKQFNKKVEWNDFVRKNKPTFEENMEYFLKNNFTRNIGKNGIKVW